MDKVANEKRDAFKESVSDTALAFAINVPLGFLIMEFANLIGIVATTYEQNIQLVILHNIVFTTVAIIRKTYVRRYFERKNRKNRLKFQN